MIEALDRNTQSKMALPHVSVVSRNKETKESPEMIKAIEWVKSHPELATMPLRQAADLAGVSYSTLRRAKQSEA